MVFLFQGDSITDGNRGRNYNDLNHIMGHGYQYTVASKLGYDFAGRNMKFINRGISGNRVTNLADRWKVDCLDLNPDVVSILIGINDSSSAIMNPPSQNPGATATSTSAGNNPGSTPGSSLRQPVTLQIYNDVYRSLLDKVVQQKPDVLFVLLEPFVFRHPSTEKNWDERYKDVSERQKIVGKIALDYNAVFVMLQKHFDSACNRAPAEYWI